MLRALLLIVFTAASVSLASAQEPAGPVYELRIYTANPDRFEALQSRFRDHTIKLFEKHGMKNVGYWIPVDGDGAKTTLIYLLEHKSRDAAKASWAAFQADPDWQAARTASEAAGRILSKSPEVVFLTKADYSPAVTAPLKDKTYELRVYTAPEGKLEPLHTRFRNHSVALLNKHKLPSIGYFKPVDAPASQSKMYYILEAESKESAAASWKAFLADPDWVKAYAESEKDGKLTTEVLSTFMKPVGFSPLR